MENPFILPICWMDNLSEVGYKKRVRRYDSPSCNRASICRLTIMLTEQCNLNCWMCDFARSKGLSKHIPFEVDEFIELLNHPVLASLQSVTLTGGEPFIFPKILLLYKAIIENKPNLCVNFSSNGTLLKQMVEVFEYVKNWRMVNLFISIDGIKEHDIQRGVAGMFDIVVRNLKEFKFRFPNLRIVIKFTITPINYDELEKTFKYFTSRGYSVTIKIVENNPYYTNKISYNEHIQDFTFTNEQIVVIKTQLINILKISVHPQQDLRASEIKELLKSLAPGWQRSTPCSTPTERAFIDSKLNFYSCKEYPPILNLTESCLDKLATSDAYLKVIDHERKNTGHCTRCTSQMRVPRRANKWSKFLRYFIH